jgi:hypothetical protein
VFQKQQAPRLFWVESEFHTTLLDAELAYARKLIDDIDSGALKGIQWWRTMREHDGPVAPPIAKGSAGRTGQGAVAVATSVMRSS